MDCCNKKLSKKIISNFLASLFATLAFSSLSNAELCRKDGIILQHKFRQVVASELKSIQDNINVNKLTGRSIVGTLEKQKRVNKDVECVSSANICNKLMRDARKKGFSSFRRANAFACSADYKVSVSTTRNKWRPITNDSYLKAQKFAIANAGLSRVWIGANNSAINSDLITVVIDTGADFSHPDLALNLLPGKNFALGNTSDDASDDNGHGTHVAGTVSALGNNNLGVAGVAWNTKVLPIKFLAADGSGYLSDAVRAVNYMVYLKQTGLNIRVSNNSWGGGPFSEAMFEAIKSANDASILFVAAAGNEANNNDSYLTYPADYDVPNVISVGALEPFDSTTSTLAYFSNYGRRNVDIAAPGSNIASTYPGGGYVYLSGTSMASPHVAGALTLLASNQSWLSNEQLKQRVLSTTKYNPELRGYIKDAGQLNVRNMLINNVKQSLNWIRKIQTKAKR
jgi:subtilisin family serine protease